ncbi:hypothetical protein [Streptomyces marincola]|uniref:hypothetical protein n=1 Tax=Streptomyces marincola TaxID=2878388 RepID=UPI001CF2795A|nr:hypothetical protein [Streptomyces marincola]UCM89250.1 hypothetical protein LC193_15565 [Streptomyces marincola]
MSAEPDSGAEGRPALEAGEPAGPGAEPGAASPEAEDPPGEAGPRPAGGEGHQMLFAPGGVMNTGHGPLADEWRQVVSAPGSVINFGPVHGGQRLANHGGPGSRADSGRVESRDGPITAEEILRAKAGFAEPPCYPEALAQFGSRVLFLSGAPGTGRRTLALNLLGRHSGSLALRAVDSDVDLAQWRPEHRDARGYLLDGLTAREPLRRTALDQLRVRLKKARAHMVIVLPQDPALLHRLKHELDVTPVRHEPPPPHDVLDARLADAVPDPAERARLLAGLAPGLLDELLVPELVPAQVAELVDELAAGNTDADSLRGRLSFLATEEAPRLLHDLRGNADSLALLLATCVFEGLDHRVVRDEAERLLRLADGRLDAMLPSSAESEVPRPNPAFVFRTSLSGMMNDIGARSDTRETRSASGFDYTVEPVRFTRHRRGEAVLRHVWREYGHLSPLLTDWLQTVPAEEDLVHPVGRVMGMAARWGGGRRALAHIATLAGHDRMTTRGIAAYALGMAAEDPVLAGEVRHRLGNWSHAVSWQLRSTVAYACGSEFGASRPEQALRLLRRLGGGPRGHDEDPERGAQERIVARGVRHALVTLSMAGNQSAVLDCLAEWAGDTTKDAEPALRAFQYLLTYDARWLADQLLGDRPLGAEGTEEAGRARARVTALVRATLADDELFMGTATPLLGWCLQGGLGDERRRAAVDVLLTDLAGRTRHGELRLFVLIDETGEREDVRLAGVGIARQALRAWRDGRTP